MKNHITSLLWAMILIALLTLTAGCAGTARLDGGRSSVYKPGAGKRLNGPSVSLLGGQLRLLSFEKEENLTASIDEPVIAAGSSVASKSSAENLAALSERNPTNGAKRVSYGAVNVGTEAQQLADIISKLEELKNRLPRVE